MGEPPQAVPNRLAHGEQTDVILMVGLPSRTWWPAVTPTKQVE